MKYTVATNARGDWCRVYAGRELVSEGHPGLERIRLLLANADVEYIPVEDFDLLEEAGGEVMG